MRRSVRTGVRFLHARSISQSGQTRKVNVTIRSDFKLCLKSSLGNNSKTTKVYLMKLHWKIKHNKKVCHTQDLGYHIQGQGLNLG